MEIKEKYDCISGIGLVVTLSGIIVGFFCLVITENVNLSFIIGCGLFLSGLAIYWIFGLMRIDIKMKEISEEFKQKDREKHNRIPISNKLKHEIWRRDNFTCQYCGRNINEVVLEVDHILPVSKGGTNAPSNLQTLCFDCNRSKRDK